MNLQIILNINIVFNIMINQKEDTVKVKWSNGVPFLPPSERFWRIGGKWYDFTNFLDKHPGGSNILEIARDRFEDCTFAFESHHHDFVRARAIIQKYEVHDHSVLPTPSHIRPYRIIDANKNPKLLDNNAFYSVLRKRVTEYLRTIDNPQGLPTWECIIYFWLIFTAWIFGGLLTWYSGSLIVSSFWGIISSWLGAFGHNWVHQPKYKKYGWAMLSLDTIGFSSDNWYRQHILQHHMYTNTPWDNHFTGTDPFLKTDPTVERSFIQKYITPYINPLLLSCGLYVNYLAHTKEMLYGNEEFSIGKLFLPLQFMAMISRWGTTHGILLLFMCHAVLGVYYFTMALMNHNASHCMDVYKRNKSKDWGIAQLNSSVDWCVGFSFRQAIVFLWLNFHTVHHMFPKIDFSHHPAIQKILIQTCNEFDIDYNFDYSPITIYKQMIKSFASPRSLMQEIMVYAGGI